MDEVRMVDFAQMDEEAFLVVCMWNIEKCTLLPTVICEQRQTRWK